MFRFHGLTEIALRILAAAGLVVDAVVHLDIASTQPPAPSGQIDQSTLFRLESVASIIAAVAVLVLSSAWASALAAVVAGSACAAVVLSVYVDLGSIGPLPDLYEPAWYESKATCAVAEAVAFLAAIAALVMQVRRHRSHTAGRRHSGVHQPA